MIIDGLIEKIADMKAPVCAGLDTRIEYFPDSFAKEYDLSGFTGAAAAVFEFNRVLIDALCRIVPCIKIQNAFYEMYGIPGIESYQKTIEYARSKGMFVIADVKRGDIGSSSAAYSAAHIGLTVLRENSERAFDSDFMTVNPYFGIDGLQPFIDDCIAYQKGIFVLVKTSNPSSCQLQDLELESGGRVYEKVAELVDQWGRQCIGRHGYSSVGAVVGATHPQEGAVLRKNMKHTFFLLPGYGAQGASAQDVRSMLDRDGMGGIVNSSRALLLAWKAKNTADFAAAAVEAAQEMIDDLNA